AGREESKKWPGGRLTPPYGPCINTRACQSVLQSQLWSKPGDEARHATLTYRSSPMYSRKLALTLCSFVTALALWTMTAQPESQPPAAEGAASKVAIRQDSALAKLISQVEHHQALLTPMQKAQRLKVD